MAMEDEGRVATKNPLEFEDEADAQFAKHLAIDVREVECPVYASIKFIRACLPNPYVVWVHRFFALAASIGMLAYDPDMKPLEFAANGLIAMAYSTSAATLPFYARAVAPGGPLESLGMGSALISKHDKKRLDHAWPRLLLTVQLPIAIAGLLFMYSGLFKVGKRSAISGRVITPSYGLSLFFLGFSTFFSVQVQVAGNHSLKVASVLAGQDVTAVIQNARKHLPADPSWKEKVARPALELATHTMPQLSKAYGSAVGLFTATFWLASMGSLAMWMENYSPGILFFCLLFAFMPLLAAADVAHTSTYCDYLREELNKQRVKDLLQHGPLYSLEQALDRLNHLQGLGFVVYSVVVDKVTLERVFMTLCSVLSTVLPFIWALKPADIPDGDGLVSCELSPQEHSVIRTLINSKPLNETCTYNMTLASLLVEEVDFADVIG